MPLFGKIPPLELNNFETAQTERANRCISFQWGEKLRGRGKKAHSNIINTVCYTTSFCENITWSGLLRFKGTQSARLFTTTQKPVKAKMQPNARQ